MCSAFSTHRPNTRKVTYGYRLGDLDLPMWSGIKPSFGLMLRPGLLRFNQVRRPVAVSLGPCVSCLPKPDLGDGLTLVGGVLKRFAFDPPKPEPGKLDELKQFVRKLCIERLIPLEPATDVSVDTWVKGINHPDWRKQELLDVYHLVVEVGPATWDQARVQCFMKDEGYIKFKQARAINARKDEMKVRFGPIFSAIEKEVYKMEEFIKHIPTKDRARYINEHLRRTGVKYVCSDFVSYESLFTSGLMAACERELYDHMTRNLPEHDEFMRNFDTFVMGKNHLRNKFFTASLDATRMSGEMCTSLGNGWTTMCVFYFVCKEVGFGEPRLVVEGDDNACSGEGHAPTVADFAKLGMVITLEEYDSFSEMSFCGLVFDEEELEVLTDPRKVLASCAWTSREYVNARSGKLKALLRCKGLSMLYQYPACPVVTSLASYILRETSGVDVRFVLESRGIGWWQRSILLEALKMPLEAKPVGPGSREVVEKVFGLDAATQTLLENYFDCRQGLGEIVEPWIIDLMPEDWQRYFTLYSHDHRVGESGDAGFWWPKQSEQRELLISMLPDLQRHYVPAPRS